MARPSPSAWRRSAAARSSWCSRARRCCRAAPAPPPRALIDIAVGADREGRLVAIEGTYRMDAGGLPGLSPSLRHAGLGRALPVPQPQPAGLRRRHQQAAHRGLSRPRRHPGLLRHGAGDGRAVPAARHGPARVPQAQRLGHRQHHADRHAVSRHRPHDHPRPASAGTPAGRIRCPRAATRAGAAWRSATGAARR